MVATKLKIRVSACAHDRNEIQTVLLKFWGSASQELQNTSDQGYWDMHLVTFNDTSYFV